VLQKIIECIEFDEILRATVLCEPQLGKRGLYPTISAKYSSNQVRNMMNFLAYADGYLSCISIANEINMPVWEIKEIISKLLKEGLLEVSK
jgi:aminopeptidase-like protein